MVDNHTCSKMQRTKSVTPGGRPHGRVILLQVVRTTFTGEASGGRLIARAEVGIVEVNSCNMLSGAVSHIRNSCAIHYCL